MKVYAFDLLPWPYLDEPSYYPDANALFDPARGREVYAEHLDQMAMYEEYGFDAICMNEHHSKPYGLMPSPNIIAAALTQRTRRIKIVAHHRLIERDGFFRERIGEPRHPALGAQNQSFQRHVIKAGK